MNDDIASLDATAQAALVRTGQVTALELVDAAIERIEALDPTIHAMATVDFEAARRRARDCPPGPLAGVPFVIKDLAAYPGMRHAMGSRLFAANVPSEPTPYSQRIDAAGLIVLGKATTSELGLLGSTETLLDGVTRNPWDPTRSAGGSSGGSAAAVASGMVPFAHASDGGGSIRGPASLNGLFGFKPGADRVVPTAPDNMAGLLVDHCVSRSVRDSALLLSLTERTDGALPPVGHVTGPSTRRLRIGCYTRTLMGHEPSAAALAGLHKTAALCRELGHEIVDTPAPDIDGRVVSDVFFTLAGAGINQLAAMMEPMLGRPVGDTDLEPFTLSLLAWYRTLPEHAAPAAMARVGSLGAAMRAFVDRFDAVMCPTIPVPVFELGTLAPTLEREVILERTEKLAGYTAIHNMADLPAMSLPLHTSPEGWPVGSHIAAPRGHEATLLALAYELEAASPWPGPARMPGTRD